MSASTLFFSLFLIFTIDSKFLPYSFLFVDDNSRNSLEFNFLNKNDFDKVKISSFFLRRRKR